MLDRPVRRVLDPGLDRVAGFIDRRWLTPNRLTAWGLVTGLASGATAANGSWWWSLALWLISRLADGLDGPLARRRVSADSTGGHHDRARHDAALGGFLDISADFVVYGATVVGVAVGAHGRFGAPWWPFLLVLFAYYINGTILLAFSSIAERIGKRIDDGRSLSFLRSLAEGTETIIVHSLWLIAPQWAAPIALIWSIIVTASAVQRVVLGYRLLR